MHTFAVAPSSLRHPAVAEVLSDQLAWHRARALRSRLAPACVAAALLALALATNLPHPGLLLHWAATPACLAPLAWAMAHESQLRHRVSDSLARAAAKKVIKTP